MRIVEYSIGQIQCILASERAPRELVTACDSLIAFLGERENRMQNYQVKKEVRLVREKKDDLPRRKLVSIERDEFEHCVVVSE